MSALRRAFVAVVPPPPVLDAIDGLFDRTGRSKFRWTRRDQWHVTIQYFGKVADADDLVGALAGAVASVASPRVQLVGAGAFPSPRSAAVFWLGVRDPEPLAAVHAAVAESAADFIRPRDRTSYVAHLTLARCDSRRRITNEVEALASAAIGPVWTADDVVLFESETRRGGAMYREIARLPLAPESGV